MSEDSFYNLDYSSLISILENKLAYENFMDYVREKERERINRGRR